MMSDKKISDRKMDRFKRNYQSPFDVERDNEPSIDEWSVFDKDGNYVCCTNSSDKADAISETLNSHDRLVSELEELKGDNRIHKATSDCLEGQRNELTSGLEAKDKIIEVAVNALKDIKSKPTVYSPNTLPVGIHISTEALALIEDMKGKG